jgi:mannose-6-phosphate isomerase-like protein (cupin superfamily)
MSDIPIPISRNEEQLSWETRPWGRFSVVWSGPELTVKLLEVDPSQALSLQFHDKRSESWVLLEDAPHARFVINGRSLTPIPEVRYDVGIRIAHRIVNDGPVVARILEIIQGEYDEQDIVRINDRYGR